MFHPPVLAQIFRDKEQPSEAPARPQASGRGQSSPGKDPRPPQGPSMPVAGPLTQAPGWASNGTRGRGLALPWVSCFLSLAGLGRPGPRCGPEDLAAPPGVLCGADAGRVYSSGRRVVPGLFRVSHSRLHLFFSPKLAWGRDSAETTWTGL